MSEHTPAAPAHTAAPEWLPTLQRDLSRALLTPLICDGNTFLTPPASRDVIVPQLRDDTNALHDVHSATVEQRVELYQRQYWMRLFGALQESFARVALHMGHFAFNRLALQYLQAHPPTSVDLAALAPEFGGYLRQELPKLAPSSVAHDRAAIRANGHTVLLQALAFDEAELKAFQAPWSEPWRPTADELALLPTRQLVITPSFSLLREDWPLAERPGSAEHVPLALTPLKTARYWVCSRTQWSIALRLVEPAFARLLHATQSQPLERAVAALQPRLNPTTRQALTEKLPQWTQVAIAQSWWLGLLKLPSDTPALSDAPALSDTQV